jgi:enoyl-CoA hydratase/carnithine racemase
MHYTYLNITEKSKVTVITLNRPEKGNALSPQVLQELEDAFRIIATREDVNVVVLTGGEKQFSAGFDLNEIRKIERESNELYINLFHRTYRSIMFCPQPVICAVGGPAIAGGFDLTLMCDIRYASEKAKFGQREILLSLTPVLDPLWRIIGLGRAKEVTLTGRIYDAYEAEKMGYVSKVFSEDSLLESVKSIATEMALNNRKCLIETKALSHKVLNEDLTGAMEIQEWLFRSYLGSDDNHMRIDYLLDKIANTKRKSI